MESVVMGDCNWSVVVTMCSLSIPSAGDHGTWKLIDQFDDSVLSNTLYVLRVESEISSHRSSELHRVSLFI